MDINPREDLEKRIRLLHEQELRLEEELSALRENPDHEMEVDGDDLDARIAETPPRISEAPPPKPRGNRARRILLRLALVPLAMIAIVAGLRFWNYLSSYESTDDAQIDGHIVPISFRITGTISRVLVKETQMVEAGQLIAEIDPRDVQAAVDNARANLAQAKALVGSARADYQASLSKVRQDEAAGDRSRKDAARYTSLYGQHVVSGSEYDDKVSTAAVNDAAIESDRANANAARTSITSRQAAVKAAQASLDQALLNLGYTKITAPMRGVIGKKTVEVGQRVQPGQLLLAIVPLDDIWVTANFKETQLRKIKTGQRVSIAVDATGTEYEGNIEGMAGASGEKYSLLPPENATGNYVKVVQRLPVRIRLKPGQDPDHRLRLGMSAEPTVWIKSAEPTVWSKLAELTAWIKSAEPAVRLK
jgi:membrane fusion protein (multidrug efflux system)